MEYNKEIGKKGHRLLGRKGPRDMQRQGQQTATPSPPNEAMFKELKDQLTGLTNKLAEQPAVPSAGLVVPPGMFTAEEFDEELAKQIVIAEQSVENKYNKDFVLLESKLVEITNKNENLNTEIHKLRKELKFQIETTDKQKVVIDGLEKQYLDLEKEKDKLDNKITSLLSEIEAKESIIKTKDESIEVLKTRSFRIGEDETFIDDPDRPEMEVVFVDPVDKEEDSMESHIDIKEKEVKTEVLGDKVNKLKNLIGGFK